MGQNTNTFLIKFFFFCYCPPFIIRTLGLLPNSHYTDLVPLTGFLTWSLAQIQFDCVEFIIPKCPFGILIVLGWLFSLKKKKKKVDMGKTLKTNYPFVRKFTFARESSKDGDSPLRYLEEEEDDQISRKSYQLRKQ